MNKSNKYWVFVLISFLVIFTILFIIGYVFWSNRTPEEKKLFIQIFETDFVYIFSALILLIGGLAFLLDGIFNIFIIPVGKIADEADIIYTVNPGHRLEEEGPGDIKRLRETINRGADRYDELVNDVQQQIEDAKQRVENEKDTLAAVMSDLPEGVLICNTEGRILLYNKQARNYLEKKPESEEAPVGGYIGLGRSVFGLFDKNLVLHAFDDIAKNLNQKVNSASTFFVIIKKEKHIRAEVVPVLSRENRLTGYVFIFYDISRHLESENRIRLLVQTLTRSFRSSAAGIRSAVEAIQEFPDMETAKLNRFLKIIHEESKALGKILDETVPEFLKTNISHWPLVDIRCSDVLSSVKAKSEKQFGVVLNVENASENGWIKADSYLFFRGLLFILYQISQETGKSVFDCRIYKKYRFINIDFSWEGKPISSRTIRSWEDKNLDVENETIPVPFEEVVRHHEMEIWSQSDLINTKRRASLLRIMLPAVEISRRYEYEENLPNISFAQERGFDFYDFDLFNQPGQSPELDNLPLTGLSFTVFDLETTGLDPKISEIISIGAVRIINGRLLHDEIFDQLIDPKQRIPVESTRVHGITQEIVQDQPTIAKVLPDFKEFVEDTILVAHNAAFDMKMLEMKEPVTGIRFINPVLDTLLLSTVIHPRQKKHEIETIARRLGIRMVGRHTALGDAITTGEIFIKFIPLLQNSGIVTLKDAREASQKSYYTRLKY